MARASVSGCTLEYIEVKCAGLLPRSTIFSSNGISFSTSAMKERCAQGHVLVPLNVWLLFHKRTGGPSYEAACCLEYSAAFQTTDYMGRSRKKAQDQVQPPRRSAGLRSFGVGPGVCGGLSVRIFV